MAEIDFYFNGTTTKIQCNTNDKMDDIFIKFSTKINKDINDIFFIYNGEKMSGESSFIEAANSSDKESHKMCIYVHEISIDDKNKNVNIIKSKEIICPKCGEIIQFKFDNYKITLLECKNKHKIDYLVILRNLKLLI